VTVSNIGAAVGLALTALVILCLWSKGCRSWLTNKVGIALNWRAAIFFPIATVSLVCMLLAPPTHTAWLYWPALVLQSLNVVNILLMSVIYAADLVLDIRSKGHVSSDGTRGTGPLNRWYSRCWGVEVTPQLELESRRDTALRENQDDDGGDDEGGEGRAADEEAKSDAEIGIACTLCIFLCAVSCRVLTTAINVAVNIWIVRVIYNAYECVKEGGI